MVSVKQQLVSVTGPQQYQHWHHKGRVSHFGHITGSEMVSVKQQLVSVTGPQQYQHWHHKGRVSHFGHITGSQLFPEKQELASVTGQQQHRVFTQTPQRESFSLGTTKTESIYTQTARRESFSLGTTTTQSIDTVSTKGEFLTWDNNNIVYLYSQHKERVSHLGYIAGSLLVPVKQQGLTTTGQQQQHRQHEGRVSHLGQQQHRVSTQTAQRESFLLGTTTQRWHKGEFLTWDNNNTEYRHRQHKGRVSHLGQQHRDGTKESFSLGTHRRKSALPSQTARTDNNNRTTTTTQSIDTDSTKGEFLTWDNNTEVAQRRVSHLGHIAGSQLFPVKQQGVSDRTKWVEVYQHNFILKHGQQQIMIPYISIFLGKSIGHHFFSWHFLFSNALISRMLLFTVPKSSLALKPLTSITDTHSNRRTNEC